MKKVFLFAALVAGVMSIASCNKEQNALPEGEKVTITVSFPEVAESKVAMEEGQQALNLKWENDDKLTVVGNTTEVFTVESVSEDGKTATFTGNAVVGDKFDVILSDQGVNYLKRDYTPKVGAASDELKYDAVLKGVNTYENVSFSQSWAEAHGGTFSETGCIMLNIQLPEGCTDITAVKLVAPDTVFSNSNEEGCGKSYAKVINFAEPQNPENGILKVYYMSSMVSDVLKASSEMAVVLDGAKKFLKEFTISKDTEIAPGKRNVITLNSQNWNECGYNYAHTLNVKKGIWCAPYTNICTYHKNGTGPGWTVDQDFNDNYLWTYIPGTDVITYTDTTFDGWSDSVNSNATMLGVINLKTPKYVDAFYIGRYTNDKYPATKIATKYGEVWLSNDTSNDAEFPEGYLNTNLTRVTNEAINGYWLKWKAKKWVKLCDFEFPNDKANSVDVAVPAPFKAKYMMVVLHAKGESIRLGVSEINAYLYNF